jgi:uncharacterized membrane protein
MEFVFGLDIFGYPILMIIWNVILALTPCITVFYMSEVIGNKKWNKLHGQQLAFIILFLFWLALIPNTAYLFTMVRHLVDYCDNYGKYEVCADGSWMVIIAFTYALIGLPTFYYALSKMVYVFEIVFNKLSAKLLPIVTIPLISIAIMFGLYERYNSWDLVFKPCNVITTAFSYFTQIPRLIDFVVFTVCLYLIFYIMQYLLKNEL